jgi:hypothetical protein
MNGDSNAANSRPQEEQTDPKPEPDSGLVADCRLMLRFARREGFDVPPDLCRDIAGLDSMLKGFGLETISQLPSKLVAAASLTSAEGSQLSPTELVLKIHAALSRIISPATAQSLQVSEPPPGRHRFLGGMPLLVKAAAWVSLISALGFLVTSIPVAKEKLENAAGGPSATSAATASATPTPTPTATPKS